MRIMVRHAEDDFHALQIANGMERASAHVLSVAYRDAKGGWDADKPRFLVWAKIASDDMIHAVDEAIEKECERCPTNRPSNPAP